MAWLFISLGWSVLVVVAVLLWRRLRHEKAQVETRKVQASETFRRGVAMQQKASAGFQMASKAVRAMANLVTAEIPDAPVREVLRTQLHDLAFSSPELFRARIDQVHTASTPTATGPQGSGNSGQRTRKSVPAVPEMPIPPEAFRAFKASHVEGLRDRVRELRNAGNIPHNVLSGSQVSNLRKREAIVLLLRYDPESALRAVA